MRHIVSKVLITVYSDGSCSTRELPVENEVVMADNRYVEYMATPCRSWEQYQCLTVSFKSKIVETIIDKDIRDIKIMALGKEFDAKVDKKKYRLNGMSFLNKFLELNNIVYMNYSKIRMLYDIQDNILTLDFENSIKK